MIWMHVGRCVHRRIGSEADMAAYEGQSSRRQ